MIPLWSHGFRQKSSIYIQHPLKKSRIQVKEKPGFKKINPCSSISQVY
ncbi:MAG: hypothetical protein P8X79_13100 [Reinekea sp.]